ncbi:acyltransferase [Mycobacterium sp. SMC-4]|uniref:acyltransferase family protein n=1 Tax=Mycobacterium sp. SMC-4 TaxID=2857059 RepID=UPI0021B34441|nr:acyltransferase [Mycobacterium sp. SMC-4]
MRAVAVLAVFGFHLWGWPRGGFIGIDVFLVVAGFFAAHVLLTTAAAEGAPFLKRFYADRARRIIPAASLVLMITLAASVYLFPPARADQVGLDAAFAFLFLANWHFAGQAVATSAATESVSPLLHFWPLSIEEQFLIVLPLVILIITVVAVRSQWRDQRFAVATAVVVGAVTAASLGWAFYQTATSPHWAYFGTFARLWELGAGALLATAVGALSQIPDRIRPVLSWMGVGVLAASAVLLVDVTAFPAPGALLPVAGTLLIIAAGVGREPVFQPALRNRAFLYVGDISYSLYLVHWPVIVLLAAVMSAGVYYDAAVLALAFGLAIALHHFVDTPIRYAHPGVIREVRRDLKHGLFVVERATKVAGVAALVLVTVSLIAYAARPDAYGASAETDCCRPTHAGTYLPQR